MLLKKTLIFKNSFFSSCSNFTELCLYFLKHNVEKSIIGNSNLEIPVTIRCMWRYKNI